MDCSPQEEWATCERLSALGVEIYEHWEEMFDVWAGRLDLCLIPAPIHLHEPISIAAMEAGANVLVEKPLAGSLEQVKSIQSCEEHTGKWVAVGYQDFYKPSVQAIRRELVDGRIGRIHSKRWIGLWPRGER